MMGSSSGEWLHGWLQVVGASDVLFLFSGSVQGIKDIIASNKSKLKENQILVAVARDGEVDDYQASSWCACAHCITSKIVCSLVKPKSMSFGGAYWQCLGLCFCQNYLQNVIVHPHDSAYYKKAAQV